MEVAWYQDTMNGLKTKTCGKTEGKPVRCWGWVTTSTKNQLILTGNMRDCNPALPTPWGTRRRSIIQEGSDTCTAKTKHCDLTKAGNRMLKRSWKRLKGRSEVPHLNLIWNLSWSTTVHSRCDPRLNKVWWAAEPIQIQSPISNWLRRCTWQGLNSLNSIRLIWSKASEPGLRWSKGAKCGALPCDRVLTSSCSMQDWLIVLASYFVRPQVARLKHVPLLSNPTPKTQNKESNICIPDSYWNAKGDLCLKKLRK